MRVRSAASKKRPDGTFTPSHETLYTLLEQQLLTKYEIDGVVHVDWAEVLALDPHTGGRISREEELLGLEEPGGPWYTVREASTMLGRPQVTVRYWIRNGKLPFESRVINGLTRISISPRQLKEYLKPKE
jgi:excisionase family DNA binding protein